MHVCLHSDLTLDMSAVSLSSKPGKQQSNSGTKNGNTDADDENSRQPNVDSLPSPSNPNAPHVIQVTHGTGYTRHLHVAHPVSVFTDVYNKLPLPLIQLL